MDTPEWLRKPWVATLELETFALDVALGRPWGDPGEPRTAQAGARPRRPSAMSNAHLATYRAAYRATYQATREAIRDD